MVFEVVGFALVLIFCFDVFFANMKVPVPAL